MKILVRNHFYVFKISDMSFFFLAWHRLIFWNVSFFPEFIMIYYTDCASYQNECSVVVSHVLSIRIPFLQTIQIRITIVGWLLDDDLTFNPYYYADRIYTFKTAKRELWV